MPTPPDPPSFAALVEEFLQKIREATGDFAEPQRDMIVNAYYAGAVGLLRFSTDNFHGKFNADRFAALLEEAVVFVKTGQRGEPIRPGTLAAEAADFTQGHSPALQKVREKIFYAGAMALLEAVTDGQSGDLDPAALRRVADELRAFVVRAATRPPTPPEEP